MEARLFSIISADGTELDLNGMDFFAHSPTGLGVSIKNDILQRDNVLYVNTRQLSMGNIDLDLVFGPYGEKSPYENFVEFSKKLAGGICQLKYYIPRVGEFYKDVVVKSMSKTDYNKQNGLAEKISFEPLSLWYQIQTIEEVYEQTDDIVINLDIEDSANIIPLHYRNELTIMNNKEYDSDEGSESTQLYYGPQWYCTHDRTHSGFDGYDVKIEPKKYIETEEGDSKEHAHFLRVGNLNGTTYAFLEERVWDDNNSWLPPISSVNVIHREYPQGMIPLCIKDGSNTITIKTTNGLPIKVTLKVKLERALI